MYIYAEHVYVCICMRVLCVCACVHESDHSRNVKVLIYYEDIECLCEE